MNFLLDKRNDNSLEWQDGVELRNDFYGVSEHRDTVRKGSKLWYEFYDAGWIREPNNIPLSDKTENNTDIYELQKERYKIQAEKVELNRTLRQHSRFELYYENIKEVIQVFPTPNFIYEINKINSNKIHVMTIADIHAGANFISENNNYSYNECENRFAKLFSYMVDYIQENNITTLKIINGGDDIQGILRITDIKLNETSVVEATVFIAKLISSFLNNLSNYCYIEYYQVPSANHSQTRPLGTKASEIASEDMEYVIGNYIKDVLVNNERISINTNFKKDYINIPIFDFNAIALHGHTIKNVKSVIKDLSMLHRKFYDYCFIAHFHASDEITVGEGDTNDVEVLVCPSFIGSCPYSDKIMKGAKASCKIFVFDEVNGHIRTDKIILN